MMVVSQWYGTVIVMVLTLVRFFTSVKERECEQRKNEQGNNNVF